MNGEARFAIRVGGDYACFTRPEFKVERVSYPVMTPSAARGVLEAIFWKPEIRWEVRAIKVLRPLRQMAILRNEISVRQGDTPIFVEERRQRRMSLVLKDVEYVIEAAMRSAPHTADPLAKYTEQVQRRLRRGQCYRTPYLGTREFAAWFEPASGDERPVALDLEIGRMLFDIAYREDRRRHELSFHRHGDAGRRVAQGFAEPIFFTAALRGGVLHVPEELYRQRERRERSDAA